MSATGASSDLEILAHRIQSNATIYREDGNEQARQALLEASQSVFREVQSPIERAFSHFNNLSTIGAIRALLQIGVFEEIPRTGSISAEQLATRLKSTAAFLVRLLRPLVLAGILKEAANGEYAHTPHSLIYLTPLGDYYAKLMLPHMMLPLLNLHQWVSSEGAVEPTSSTHNPFASTHHIEGHNLYYHFAQCPERLQCIQTALAHLSFNAPVVGVYDWAGQLALKESQIRIEGKNVATIVDISGGNGSSLLQIREAAPELKGRFILQEEKVVLDDIKEGSLDGIKLMSHSFLDQQQEQGALVYYIRRTLLNWPDETCLTVLRSTSAAMAAHSRLIIAEQVYPSRIGDCRTYCNGSAQERGCDPESQVMHSIMLGHLDLMMACIGGKCRTVADWEKLLDRAGLDIEKIWWEPSGTGNACIETKLKQASS